MSSVSEVQLCNLALSRLGCPGIQSLSEASRQARACSLHYPVARDAVLRDHPWTFARKEQTLALVSDETVSGWDYVYQYPTDCLNAIRIHDETASADPDSYYDDTQATYSSSKKIEFEVVASEDLDARRIVSNQENAILVYTAAVTNPVVFDSLFSQALVLQLASAMAVALKRSQSLAKNLYQEYLVVLGVAKASNANEGHRHEISDSAFVKARR